jgi:D-xylose 1-dehydrogenase (NADP+, D-xylono-1,5-lactone-forming)
VKLGILSTAKINRAVLTGALLSDRVDVVAVASRDAARAEAYAAEHEIERAHGSYEALLEDPEVEAVYISLPNSLHVPWSVRALEAGKHVLCEKPLDRRPAGVERAFDAADRAGRILMEAFMYRHHPQTKRLAELVAEGAIGELRLVRSSFSFPLSDETNVRLRPELDGGSLMDVGCYCLSGTRLLAGEPEALAAQQVVGPTGVDVRFAGTMSIPGGALAHFDCGFDVANRGELEAVGSEGTIVVPDPWLIREAVLEVRRGHDEVERVEVAQANRYQLELENLADAIRGEAEPLLGREDALGQARAIDALYRAAESGEVVRPGRLTGPERGTARLGTHAQSNPSLRS